MTLSLADRIAAMAPEGMGRVFFVNSGSESVDTALKIAVGWQRLRGEAARTRIIGRERAYHGVGMGGISVGGIPANRKMFAPLMIPGVDHLPHTWNPAQMAFSRGQPAWGPHLADELERLVALHDASNIAAVILEPMQGSTGVIVPPRGLPQSIREICTRHGILLIFDEVITGFGRVGAPFARSLRRQARPDHLRQGRQQRRRAAGRRARRDAIYETFMTVGPLTRSSSSTATPIPATRWPPRRMQRSTSSSERAGGARAPPRARARGRDPRLRETALTDIRNLGLAAAIDVTPVPASQG